MLFFYKTQFEKYYRYDKILVIKIIQINIINFLGVIMKENMEKDFEFFVRRGIARIIVSLLIMVILETLVMYYYLIIARVENFSEAFGNNTVAMIILPFLPLYFLLSEISKFREGKAFRKSILEDNSMENRRKKLYYQRGVNGRSDNEFGNILFIVRKRGFFNYFFLSNLMIPVFLFSGCVFFQEIPVLRVAAIMISVFLIFNIIRNLFSSIKFYEYGAVVHKISGKIRIEYKDIFNLGSIFQDNKSESRFRIGTDSTEITIDTMRYAIRFSVSTSRSKDKIHSEIIEFISEIKKML